MGDFLADTIFENQKEVEILLRDTYHLRKQDSLDQVEIGMTRQWDYSKIMDILDPDHLLPRTAKDYTGYVEKILYASNQDQNFLKIGPYTFVLSPEVKDEIDRLLKGAAYSGHDPELVREARIRTVDNSAFTIAIYKVFNRNQKFRYEYVLKPLDSEAN